MRSTRSAVEAGPPCRTWQRSPPPRALEWLDTAVRLRDLGLEQLRADPLFDPLRKEPRFQAIERELKFPD